MERSVFYPQCYAQVMHPVFLYVENVAFQNVPG